MARPGSGARLRRPVCSRRCIDHMCISILGSWLQLLWVEKRFEGSFVWLLCKVG